MRFCILKPVILLSINFFLRSRLLYIKKIAPVALFRGKIAARSRQDRAHNFEGLHSCGLRYFIAFISIMKFYIAEIERIKDRTQWLKIIVIVVFFNFNRSRIVPTRESYHKVSYVFTLQRQFVLRYVN